MNIQHMHWKWPLGKKVPLNIYPCSFNELFITNNNKYITLPIFQRHFCWTIDQFKLFWIDLIHLVLTARDEWDLHDIGKMYFFEKFDPETNSKDVIILDGQQRIATTFIILIAIKYHLLSINKHTNDTIMIQQLMDKIDKILFIDQSIVHQIPKTLKEGVLLKNVRFKPNYIDRKGYLYILFNEIQQNAVENCHLYDCYKFFQSKLKEDINEDVSFIKKIMDVLLNKFTFVITGIKYKYADKGYFIYQWLIEKSFFGFKKALKAKDARSGESHKLSQLFKNYILAFFINCDDEYQLNMFKLWISIEILYHDNRDGFDKYLLSNTYYKKLKSEEKDDGDYGFIIMDKNDPETILYLSYRDLTKMIDKYYLNRAKGNESLYPNIMRQFLISLKSDCPKYHHLIIGYVRQNCHDLLNFSCKAIIARYAL